MQFQKAQRRKAKLRLGITGPSGSGKTWGALQIAKGISGKIAVIDTERGSASLYSHIVDFDVLELEAPYGPERYSEAVQAAAEAGYDVLIIDSVTPEWSGIGGCLEIVETLANSKYRGNSWSAWNDVTPRHRAFLDTLLRVPLHVIATMRSKTETAQVEQNGKKRVVKLGMKSEQRDGIEYEFTTVLDLIHEGHAAIASKDRTGLFSGDPAPITPATGKRLVEWLESGVELLPEPERVMTNPPPADMPPMNASQAKKQLVWEDIQERINAKATEAELNDWWDSMTSHWAKLPVGWKDAAMNACEVRRNQILDEEACA